MCQVLQVSRSGYYAWRKRKPSARKMANETLLALIRLHYRRNKGVYGSPRIYAALRREGICCSRKRVARLMRLHGIQARRKRSYKVTTQSNHRFPVATNVLNQQFTAVRPNQIWLGDITYLATAEGWLYLAVLLDMYSRKMSVGRCNLRCNGGWSSIRSVWLSGNSTHNQDCCITPTRAVNMPVTITKGC